MQNQGQTGDHMVFDLSTVHVERSALSILKISCQQLQERNISSSINKGAWS